MNEELSTPQSRLAEYASVPSASKGRRYEETEDPRRSIYQRDCDRIVHSAAFRRLMHKTQVFIAPYRDHFRTRLTHTIEVTRVARSLAENLTLNPHLAEAIALAHDLGHPPFGHAGEDKLKCLMKDYGGFEHNAQAISIVTGFEQSYIDFKGLNLSWETLEGIVKHNGPISGNPSYAVSELDADMKLRLDTYGSAEAQVAAISDDIAYNCHDLQDGLRADCFKQSEIAALSLVGEAFEDVSQTHGSTCTSEIAHAALRKLFDRLVNDVLNTSCAIIENAGLRCPDDVREFSGPVVAFSCPVKNGLDEIREFLFDRMYRSNSMIRIRDLAKGFVADLFQYYMEDSDRLPENWRPEGSKRGDKTTRARCVADYISGMTDGYAMRKHKEITGGKYRDLYSEVIYGGDLNS